MNIRNLKKILSSPIVFNDIYIEIIDVIDATHPAGQVATPHKHPWYEFNYIDSGEMNVSINDDEFVATEKTFILIPSNVNHSNHWHTDDDGICIRFSMQKNLNSDSTCCYAELSSILSTPYPYCEPIDISFLLENKSQYSLQTAFVNLLFKISEIYDPTVTTTSPPLTSTVSSQVIIYLKEYYKNKIYVDDIAKAMNMSYRALAKHFKAETGMSIIEKLTEIRIIEAKRLLRTTDFTIAQIAEMTGFDDESYFSKAFTKYTQCPPSRFRK